MKIRKNLKNLSMAMALVFMVSVFTTVSPAFADVYWETITETSGMAMPPGMPKNLPKEAMEQMKKMSQPQKKLEKIYLTKNAYRMESPDGIMIMDFKTMIAYHLDPATKTYTKMDLNKMMKGKNRRHMRKMMGDMQNSIKITPTNETKKIAGYNCKKYLVEIMMTKGEYWISKDIDEYDEMKKLAENMKKVMKNHPMLGQMGMGPMMNRMDGFPVKTKMDTMGMTSTSTLKKIEKKSLDKSLFMVPKDYKLVSDNNPWNQ